MSGSLGAIYLVLIGGLLAVQAVLCRQRAVESSRWRKAMRAVGFQPVDTTEPEPASEFMALKPRYPLVDPRAEGFAWCLRAEIGGLDVWVLQPEDYLRGETYRPPTVVAVRCDALLPMASEPDPPRWFVGLSPHWLFIWSDRGSIEVPQALRRHVEEAIRMLRENGIAPAAPDA